MPLGLIIDFMLANADANCRCGQPWRTVCKCQHNCYIGSTAWQFAMTLTLAALLTGAADRLSADLHTAKCLFGCSPVTTAIDRGTQVATGKIRMCGCALWHLSLQQINRSTSCLILAGVFGDGRSNGPTSGFTKSKMAAVDDVIT